ncbi:MarR family winged helix-turn-helix transcriptional regulator [Macrococcus brunensis]|uniref:MarR family winged helix-turn-helix transcriptional regulator n=1 Tax=Macrococcus brunensis TaxID=198483 RepID=UPI001EF049AB|nr:MarR family transcriptional regulator [Macrococcus brunensis]ULG74360.1 MarR family transcriptional regulator [Macrococcus brunensis]
MEQSQRFFDLILDVRRLYVEDMNKVLTKHQLSSAQWLVFKEIAKQQPTTLVEVARSRRIEKPTATKVIHRLIELNLIETSEGKDKREKILTLTTAGSEHYATMLHEVIQKQTEILADVEQLDLVTNELSTIYQHLQKGKDE